MSRNPTPLQPGMNGEIDGRMVEVLCHVLMGIEEGGETWHWSEYLLRCEDGGAATLVYELTDNGPEWKIFHRFEPANPLGIPAASRLSVGSRVQVDGIDATVDLVGQSRVYAIEGNAPANFHVGRLDRYFNARSGDHLLVVSWNSDEVEHYLGARIRPQDVETAFGIKLPAPPPRPRGSAINSEMEHQRKDWGGIAKLLFMLLGFCALTATHFTPSCDSGNSWKLRELPALRLPLLSKLTLAENAYTIQETRYLELATPRASRLVRQYLLLGQKGEETRILIGAGEAREDAWLLETDDSAPLPSPGQLGNQREGQPLTLGSRRFAIRSLLRLRWLPGTENSRPPEESERLRHGLLLVADNSFWLLDWDPKTARLSRIRTLTSAELTPTK